MWAIAILALIGFVAELILHLASVVGGDPRDWIQPDWVLPVASFVCLIIVILAANLVEDRREHRAKRSGVVLPDQNPPWFRPILWVFIVYALTSFFMSIFVDARRGDPVRQAEGVYVEDSGHGRPAVPISADEYHGLRRLQVRRGSALFMLFYLAVASDFLFTLAGQKRFKNGPRSSWVVVAFIQRRLL
jgi:hypothetical protein